jgi:2'-5' RNA ligase
MDGLVVEHANPTVRLFLALWPPPPVREALAQLQSQWHWPRDARQVTVPKLHMTLHFIGAVPVAHVPRLGELLRVPFEPTALDLRHGRCRVWPGGIALVEWTAPPALLLLHARLAEALRAAGLPVEARPWRPHLTFARRAVGARPPPGDLPALRWDIDQGYALVRSTPARSYETLRTYR